MSAPAATATTTEVSTLALVPSIFNPRRHFDETALAELADSLTQLGMLQPIVVREYHQDPSAGVQLTGGPFYEIIAGERRWRAATLAGLATVPVRILADISDRTALQLAIVENLQRVDIDPMDAAAGYRALSEQAGLSQAEIAAAIHRSQPVIARALSLLDLPEDVAELIRTGAISASHGHVLAAKYRDFPAVASHQARLAVTNKLSVKDLSEPQYSHDLISTGLAVQLSRQDAFNTLCTACPFGAYVDQRFAATICLKPEHYRELKAAAAEAQRQILETSRPVHAPPSAIPPAGTTEGQSDAPAAPEAPGLPRILDLPVNSFERLDHTYNGSAACTTDCPCRGHALDIKGNAVGICTDPERRKGLREAQDRAAKKARNASIRTEITELHERIAAPHAFDRRGLAVVLMAALNRTNGKILAEATKRRTSQELPTIGQLDYLATLEPAALIDLAVDALLTNELTRTIENTWETAPAARWYLGKPVKHA